MFSFLLAAAAANQVPFSKDRDVRCLAAYLVAAGEAQDDASVSAEDKAGIQSIVMYFLGKLSARRPDADLRGEVMTLVGSPGYSALLTADIQNCSAEAEERGKYLSSFGDTPDPTKPAAAKP